MFTQRINHPAKVSHVAGHNYAKPTTYTNTGVLWLHAPYAYTPALPTVNDLSSAANSGLSQSGLGSQTTTMVYTGMSALTTGPYASKTLYMNFDCTSYNDPYGDSNYMQVSISYDSGSTWNSLYQILGLGTNYGYSVDVTGRDETLIQVKFDGTVLNDGGSSPEGWSINVYDIWIDGLYYS